MAAAWAALEAELDAWAALGERARLWLRDDDAVADTPALRRLLAVCRRHAIAPLIAAVPLRAEPGLFAALAGSRARVAVHGIAHANRAPPGERKRELGLDRPVAATLAELSQALERLAAMGGAAVLPVLVPPWNRIAPELLDGLPGAGFCGISGLAPRAGAAADAAGLVRADVHVDLIDWRAGRAAKPAAAVAAELAAALAAARRSRRPAAIGVLSHHLAFDEDAWRVFDESVTCVTKHPAAGWYPADRLFAPGRRPAASPRVEVKGK